jgi:hypothetical protein
VTDSFDRESSNSVEQTFTVVVVGFMVAPAEVAEIRSFSNRLRLVLLQEIRFGVDEPKPRDRGEVAGIGRSDIEPIVQGGSRDE